MAAGISQLDQAWRQSLVKLVHPPPPSDIWQCLTFLQEPTNWARGPLARPDLLVGWRVFVGPCQVALVQDGLLRSQYLMSFGDLHRVKVGEGAWGGWAHNIGGCWSSLCGPEGQGGRCGKLLL